MKCPYCGDEESKVIDSRQTEDGERIRRRRECLRCHMRFTTYELSLIHISLPNAEIMIHQPLIAGGQGGGLSGQATDIKIHADHIVRTREKMNRMLSEYTGQPLEKIQQDTERDNYLTAQQAKEYGLIDEVIAHR